ncbi:hypothetical protein GGE07_006451 [Sinorhizobium terangae]|nr:hypothetical protein [Sinorhizobium terangae]
MPLVLKTSRLDLQAYCVHGCDRYFTSARRVSAAGIGCNWPNKLNYFSLFMKRD